MTVARFGPFSSGEYGLPHMGEVITAYRKDLVYRGRNDENGTRILFNPYAVHHERAKLLLHFAQFHASDEELADKLKDPLIRPSRELLKDAEEALLLAGKQTEIKTLVYSLHLDLTEAKFYLLSREFEESAKYTKKALLAARQKHSQQGIEDVTQLHAILKQLAPTSPYVQNLGLELGIFPE